jgi:uncharacterized protein YeaO (DUF488 family)
MKIKIKRAYEAPDDDDGTRILVDRLWPRGLTKERALIDDWLKEIAPSNDLRKWFAHDPGKWEEFQERYAKELQKNSTAVALLKALAKTRTITLIYAAKDEEHNEAVSLRNWFGRL